MIKQRILLIMICCVFASSWATAQRGGATRGSASTLTEETKTALKLTDEQRIELDALQLQTTEAMDVARQERDRDAMSKAKQEERERLEEILTENQLATLRNMRSERRTNNRLEMGENKPVRESPRPNRESVRPDKGENAGRRDITPENRANMKAEIESYRAENVEPIMKAQRQKLDGFITTEDRESIATLRKAFSSDSNIENASQNKQVITLVNKYDEQISSLLMEVSANQLQWKMDQNAIRAKYAGQTVEADRSNQGRGTRPAQTLDMNDKVRFLLRRTAPTKR